MMYFNAVKLDGELILDKGIILTGNSNNEDIDSGIIHEYYSGGKKYSGLFHNSNNYGVWKIMHNLTDINCSQGKISTNNGCEGCLIVGKLDRETSGDIIMGDFVSSLPTSNKAIVTKEYVDNMISSLNNPTNIVSENISSENEQNHINVNNEGINLKIKNQDIITLKNSVVNLNGYNITNLPDGINSSDAVNKNQIDKLEQRINQLELIISELVNL